MSQAIIQTRVRPPRVAILIRRDGTSSDIALALNFLSRLWGGHYSPIIPASTIPPDDLAEYRLANIRPEFVYTLGVDHALWEPAIQAACQPRGSRLLNVETILELYQLNYDGLITDKALLHYLLARNDSGIRKRKTRLVFWDVLSPLYPIALSLFGAPLDIESTTRTPTKKHTIAGDEANLGSLIKTYDSMIFNQEITWTELNTSGLRVLNHTGAAYGPTIVLVANPVEDLSLFWNLRMQGYDWMPRWMLPLPFSIERNELHARILRDCILRFSSGSYSFNYVKIASQRATQSDQTEFADWLKHALRGTVVKHVDLYDPPVKLFSPIAFESSQLVEFHRTGRNVTWVRPQSEVVEAVGGGLSWIVDLAQNAAKRRSPYELYPPPRQTTTEILNAPNPPSVMHSRLPHYGQGPDSLNLLCANSVALVSFCLPTEKELLEELLRQHGFSAQEDEKRACYKTALKLLGGLEQASSTLSGVRALILRELANTPATVAELKGKLKLSKGTIPELSRDKHFEVHLKGLTPTQQRVGRNRLRHHWRNTLPRESKLHSLLEHWVATGILTRHFRLGSCPSCQTPHRCSRLNIARSHRCTACGVSVTLPEKIEVEYHPQPILQDALKQGLAPVALTGKFLQNLTRSSFLWLPGLKYSHPAGNGDIDIVASCDGHLVLGECKSRTTSNPLEIDWRPIMAQLKALVAVGGSCKAAFVVLAMMIDEYPQSVTDEVGLIAQRDLPIHLLGRADLENGLRLNLGDPSSPPRLLTLQDLMVDRFPEPSRPKFDEPRQIVTPILTHNE